MYIISRGILIIINYIIIILSHLLIYYCLDFPRILNFYILKIGNEMKFTNEINFYSSKYYFIIF